MSLPDAVNLWIGKALVSGVGGLAALLFLGGVYVYLRWVERGRRRGR